MSVDDVLRVHRAGQIGEPFAWPTHLTLTEQEINIVFEKYDIESAPASSRMLLEGVSGQYGFVPNLYGILAESPPALAGLMTIAEQVSKTTLTDAEQQVVSIAVSYENECSYCVSGHTGLAQMLGVTEDVTDPLRAGLSLPDPKLDALLEFSKAALKSKGSVTSDDLKRFIDAGYSKANALDVVLIISQKVLSNYAGHLVGVEVDEAFAPFAWTPHDRDAK